MELNNKSNRLLGLLVFLTISLELVLSCTISSGWASLQMNERLSISEIVVYGRTTQHTANVRKVGTKTYSSINAVFEVLCVLKEGEDPVPEEIIIEQISPRDGCSGTRDHMQLGKEAIVALKRSDTGNYRYDEVVPTMTATFAATRATLFSVGGICGLQRWQPPLDAPVNRCPVCGVANFTDTVTQADDSQHAQSCLFNGSLQVGNSGCDMFSQHAFDNTSVCIPTAYTATCVRLVFDMPTATCVCNDVNKIFHANFGDVGMGAAFAPSLTMTFVMMFVVLLSA